MSIDQFYAFGPESIMEEAVIRFSAVKRWHMIETRRIQTLAEHSAAVALLVYSVALRAPGQYFGDPAQAGMAALVHDLPEVFIGDLPTHTKRRIAGVDPLEAEVTPKEYQIPVSHRLKLLIKLCDLIEGIRFIRINGVDATANHAGDGLVEQFRAKRTQALTTWPLEVFEAFENTQIRFFRDVQ